MRSSRCRPCRSIERGIPLSSRSAPVMSTAGKFGWLVMVLAVLAGACSSDPGGCEEADLLTVPPVSESDYEVILPLGDLAPPGHTIPTDHIYYMLPREGEITREVEVRAPGDIVITRVEETAHVEGGERSFSDFSVTFSPCSDRILKFGHLTSITNAVRTATGGSDDEFCNEYGLGGTTYRTCSFSLDLEVAAGTVVGTAGGIVDGSAALDLWGFDLSTQALTWANPTRYSTDGDMLLHVVCPLSLFADDARSLQTSRLGGHSGEFRTAEPICGEVNQDLAGTAQGNWFTGVATTMHDGWDNHLALVHDNVDPSTAAISIGGVFSEPGVWLFTPGPSGQINRDFSSVKPDGTVYCFEGARNAQPGGRGFDGRLLVQLVSGTELMIERQDASCTTDDLTFNTPLSYRR